MDVSMCLMSRNIKVRQKKGKNKRSLPRSNTLPQACSKIEEVLQDVSVVDTWGTVPSPYLSGRRVRSKRRTRSMPRIRFPPADAMETRMSTRDTKTSTPSSTFQLLCRYTPSPKYRPIATTWWHTQIQLNYLNNNKKVWDIKASLVPTQEENWLFLWAKKLYEWNTYAVKGFCYGYLDHHLAHKDDGKDVIRHAEKHSLLSQTHTQAHVWEHSLTQSVKHLSFQR